MALSEEKKKRHREYMRTRYQNDPVHRAKQKARVAVGHAIRDGRLKKGVCETCATTDVAAYHENFDFPLSIRWFCRKHRPTPKEMTATAVTSTTSGS